MIYLTHSRLMRESERTVDEAATCGEPRERSVCRQLLADRVRYFVWHSKHEGRMEPVAKLRRRDLQLLALRRAAIELIHRTALVRYLREHRVPGVVRDRVLREYYGTLDARDAAIIEHRSYLVASSSQLCAIELLELSDDHKGVEQIQLYEAAYAQYFGLFCERARAKQDRRPFLLADLLPEVRGVADRLRLRVLSGHLLPQRTLLRIRLAA